MTEPGQCQWCGNPVHWYDTATGRRVPLMPQQIPTTAVPPRFRWCVDAGIARHGTHPSDPDLCRLNHAVLCPTRPEQEQLPDLPTQLAQIRTALGAAHRKLLDHGFTPTPPPEPDNSTPSTDAEPDSHHDAGPPDEDVRHLLAYGDTWLRLLPGRIENLQCVAAHAGRRCMNPVYRPTEGAWQPMPIPAHGSRATQNAINSHAGTMWVWALHPHTHTTQVMRWYQQRCPDHAAPGTPDAAPRDLTPYDPVRHSRYILGDRPHGYDTPTTATGILEDGRQQCTADGCTHGNAGPHETGWLCWTCRPAADRRRRRTAPSRWRNLVAEHTHSPYAARPSRHGVDTVLSAIPVPVIRALGGTLAPDLVALAHSELESRTAAELVDRIERRWGARWANVRLRRHPRDTKPDSYPAHDVARHLLAPTDCRARCEDGWSRDLHTPCPTCLARRRAAVAERRARQEEFADQTGPTPTSPAERTTAHAITHRPDTYRECDGRGGSCGRPVHPPQTQCRPCRGWTHCECGTLHDPTRTCPTCNP